MTTFNIWKPVQVTHAIDDLCGTTLCGVKPGDDWEIGGVVGEDVDFISCANCQRVIDKRNEP